MRILLKFWIVVWLASATGAIVVAPLDGSVGESLMGLVLLPALSSLFLGLLAAAVGYGVGWALGLLFDCQQEGAWLGAALAFAALNAGAAWDLGGPWWGIYSGAASLVFVLGYVVYTSERRDTSSRVSSQHIDCEVGGLQAILGVGQYGGISCSRERDCPAVNECPHLR